MSGVVLISIIGAPASALPTLIDMKNYLEAFQRVTRMLALVRLGDETDLHDATALQVEDDPADRFITRVLVTTDVEFRLRHLAGLRNDLLEEHLLVRDQRRHSSRPGPRHPPRW